MDIGTIHATAFKLFVSIQRTRQQCDREIEITMHSKWEYILSRRCHSLDAAWWVWRALLENLCDVGYIHNSYFYPRELYFLKKARGCHPVPRALKVAGVRRHQPLQAMRSQWSDCRLAQKIISDPFHTFHPEYQLLPQASYQVQVRPLKMYLYRFPFEGIK